MEGGIRFIEVTMNSASCSVRDRQVKGKVWSEQIHIGAGTVLDVQQAKEALQAGATYLITPNVNANVIAYAVSKELKSGQVPLHRLKSLMRWSWERSAVKVYSQCRLWGLII